MTAVTMPDDDGRGQARRSEQGADAAAARILRRLAAVRPSFVLAVTDDPIVRAAVVAKVQRLAAAGVGPPALHGAQVEELDALAVSGSAAGPAGLDARLRAVGGESSSHPKLSVLVLHGVEALVTSTRSPAVLGALVSRSGVRILAATDSRTSGMLADDPVLRSLVTKVHVSEPIAGADTPRRDVHAIAEHHGVDIEAAAVDAAQTLVAAHLAASPPRATVLDVLDETAAAAAERGQAAVAADDIRALLAQRTGIPLNRLLADDLTHLRNLEQRLHERVVGQDPAVATVAAAVRRRRTGVGDPNRPLGSFLFLGPTGVGKTELARALAVTLFADERALIRLDMGEYQEPHSVARLVGAPPGYVGYGHGGHLSEALRRHPASVVLLDEIEKAHDDVFSTLLAVLEDGRLTDGEGRTLDVRHAVVIMTSNLGTRATAELAEAADADAALAAVAERFSPEFRNRIDEIIVFTRLNNEHLRTIVDLQLRHLQHRLAARDITLEITAQARGWLAARADDPAYGARPLRRHIRRHVEDPVADSIVSGRLSRGQAVTVDVQDEALSARVSG